MKFFSFAEEKFFQTSYQLSTIRIQKSFKIEWPRVAPGWRLLNYGIQMKNNTSKFKTM